MVELREIKFRALTNNNIMVHGYYVYDEHLDLHHINTGKGVMVQINPDALGQYIGLKDKNGVDIYEGDIVIASYEGEEDGIHEVKYMDHKGYPAFDLDPYVDCECNGLSYYGSVGGLEVIGDIHQHPERLHLETFKTKEE